MTLNVPDLKITDLLTDIGVIDFKNKFSLNADQFRDLDSYDRVNVKFEQKVVVTDKEGNETEYDYYDDYLKPAISKLPNTYLKDLKLKAKGIYSTDARINFLKQKEKELHSVIGAYKETIHLNSTDNELIISELENLSDRLNDRIEDLTQLANDKITFNLNKNQVLLLFRLLHELSIIKGITIYDLMHFLENHVNFKNHQEIKGANKSLNTELTRLKKSVKGVYKLNDQALLDLINDILKI